MKKNNLALILVLVAFGIGFMSAPVHAKAGVGGAASKADIIAAKDALKAVKKNGGTKEQILAAKEALKAVKNGGAAAAGDTVPAAGDAAE